MYSTAIRTGGFDASAAAARRPGSIASSHGKASVAPTPRSIVRREIGNTPEGKPLYTVRLWGHPTTARRKKEDPGNR
jgi:hypothetical protein